MKVIILVIILEVNINQWIFFFELYFYCNFFQMFFFQKLNIFHIYSKQYVYNKNISSVYKLYLIVLLPGAEVPINLMTITQAQGTYRCYRTLVVTIE